MTTGEGGILCTNNKIRDFCLSFRNHGMVDRDTIFSLDIILE